MNFDCHSPIFFLPILSNISDRYLEVANISLGYITVLCMEYGVWLYCYSSMLISTLQTAPTQEALAYLTQLHSMLFSIITNIQGYHFVMITHTPALLLALIT